MSLKHFLCFLFLFWLLISVGGTFKGPTYGLKPEYPENRLREYMPGGSEIEFTEIDSFQPTFKWESFPRSQDIKEDNQYIFYMIKDVTYDLKIWNSTNEFPDSLIYSRQGLPEPFHKIEQLLEPCTKYFWTIRARFKINGETRVTEWGISERPRGWTVRRSSIIPNPNLYRFKTPCIKTFVDKKQDESDKSRIPLSSAIENFSVDPNRQFLYLELTLI